MVIAVSGSFLTHVIVAWHNNIPAASLSCFFLMMFSLSKFYLKMNHFKIFFSYSDIKAGILKMFSPFKQTLIFANVPMDIVWPGSPVIWLMLQSGEHGKVELAHCLLTTLGSCRHLPFSASLDTNFQSSSFVCYCMCHVSEPNTSSEIRISLSSCGSSGAA